MGALGHIVEKNITITDGTPNLDTDRPFYHDRRASDASSECNRTRIAVLEATESFQNIRLDSVEDQLRATVDKLDQTIQNSTTHHIVSERALANVTASIDELSTDLRSTTILATEASKLAEKHEAIGVTIFKLGSVLTVIVGAIWAIAKYILGF